MDFNAENLKKLRPLSGDGSKLYIETYGCQMNVSDSEVVLSILQRDGYRYTERIDEADVILVNTCSVRDNAEQRVLGRLREFKPYKRRKKALLVGVIGCMAERMKEQLMEREQLVDIVAGPDSYRDLPRLLRQAGDGSRSVNVLLSLMPKSPRCGSIRTASALLFRSCAGATTCVRTAWFPIRAEPNAAAIRGRFSAKPASCSTPVTAR